MQLPHKGGRYHQDHQSLKESKERQPGAAGFVGTGRPWRPGEPRLVPAPPASLLTAPGRYLPLCTEPEWPLLYNDFVPGSQEVTPQVLRIFRAMVVWVLFMVGPPTHTCVSANKMPQSGADHARMTNHGVKGCGFEPNDGTQTSGREEGWRLSSTTWPMIQPTVPVQ